METTGSWVYGTGGMSSLFHFWHLVPQMDPYQFFQGARKVYLQVPRERVCCHYQCRGIIFKK